MLSYLNLFKFCYHYIKSYQLNVLVNKLKLMNYKKHGLARILACFFGLL